MKFIIFYKYIKGGEILIVVYSEALGKCEHCGTIICIEFFPIESIDSEWKCPNCEGKITHKSFGFDKGTKGCKKIKWVSSRGEWIEIQPEENFELGHFSVVVGPSGTYF